MDPGFIRRKIATKKQLLFNSESNNMISVEKQPPMDIATYNKCDSIIIMRDIFV